MRLLIFLSAGMLILWLSLILFTKENFINTISSDYIQKDASLASQPNEEYLVENSLSFFTDRLQQYVQRYPIPKMLIPQKISPLHRQQILSMVQEIFPEYNIPHVQIFKVEYAKYERYDKSLSRVILHRSYKHHGVALELDAIHLDRTTYLQSFTVLGIVSEDKIHLPTPYNLSSNSVKFYQDKTNDSLIISDEAKNETICKYYQQLRVFRKLEPQLSPEYKLCGA